MKLFLALVIIIFLGCKNDKPIEYYQNTSKVIAGIKAKRNADGHVLCTLFFVGGGSAVVGYEKGECLKKGDTINVITFASKE